MAGQSWTKSLNKIPFGPVLELWWWRAGRSRAAAIFGAIMIQLRPGSSSSSLWWVAAVIRGDSTNRNTGGHIGRNIQVTTKPGADDRLASIVDMVTLVHTSYHHTASVQVLQCEYDCVRQPRLLHARLASQQQPPSPGAAPVDQNYHKLIAECFN